MHYCSDNIQFLPWVLSFTPLFIISYVVKFLFFILVCYFFLRLDLSIERIFIRQIMKYFRIFFLHFLFLDLLIFQFIIHSLQCSFFLFSSFFLINSFILQHSVSSHVFFILLFLRNNCHKSSPNLPVPPLVKLFIFHFYANILGLFLSIHILNYLAAYEFDSIFMELLFFLPSI